MKKLFLIIVIIFLVSLICLIDTIRIRYGGGRDFENRSSAPALPASALKIVAALDEPPGNIAVSAAGRIYITDVEHGAILSLGPDKNLRTLIKDPRLRWPDGLSFGPDHWLYISDSALQDVMFKSKRYIRSKAPHYIFKLKPGPPGIAGQ